MKRKHIAVIVGVMGVVAAGGWCFLPRTPTIHFVKFSRPSVAVFEIRNDSSSEFTFSEASAPAMAFLRLQTVKGVTNLSIFRGFSPEDLTIPARSLIRIPVEVQQTEAPGFRIGIQFKQGSAERPNKVEKLIREIRRKFYRFLPQLEPIWSEFIPIPQAVAEAYRVSEKASP